MIRFRKLYDNNPLDGVYSFALVTFTKRPYLQKLDEEDKPYIAQYQKHLVIELWLCVVRLEWLTKEQQL